ncbi:Abi family protein [Shewanella sp. MF05960]|uniref:Abi family protein n=1 Tax=Shewanella sp. MF05960 TaxID=3434874 RepID=UPI003D7B0C6B
MPYTITYAALSNVLPHQRLSMYEKVFKTTTPIELHGAYIWSVKVAASIHPLLSALEVALRNSIHNNATQVIAPDWYDKIATRTRKRWQDEQRDTNNIKWHSSELLRIKKKLSKKTPPKGLTMHDLLVAKMDFGFWDNLLRECFSINGDKTALWPQCMPMVFPHLPKGHTNATVQLEISSLRELRNDIAHNSPIWKHKSVTDSQSAIGYINQQIDKIIEIIHWLSSEKVDWLEVHMLQSEAKRVASENYLLLCQRKDITNLTEPYSRYKRGFRSKLKQLNKDGFDIIDTQSGDLFMLTKLTS